MTTTLPIKRIGSMLWLGSDHEKNASWRVHRADGAGSGHMHLCVAFDSGRFSGEGWLSIDQARALIAMLTEQVSALDPALAEQVAA